MFRTSRHRQKPLSDLENQVMDLVWTGGPMTAEAVRDALAPARPLKDSTIRTVLRRLEDKGYLTHEVSGRTYVYAPAAGRDNVAVGAVRQIIDRLCGGSVEQLLVGMVESEVIGPSELERLAKKIAAKRKE